MDSWPNLSLPSTAKSEQDSLGTEESNDVPDKSKHEKISGAHLFTNFVIMVFNCLEDGYYKHFHH